MGGFDSNRDWYEASESYDFQQGTLGPLSVTRAIVAQVLNGESIDRVAVSAFELGERSQLSLNEIQSKRAVNDDIAFWLTNARGQQTLYLYKKLNVDDAQASGIVDNLHALLAHVSQPKQVVQLQKAIPSTLLDDAVVCDQRQGMSRYSQPVFVNEGAMSQVKIPLRSISSAQEWIRPAFGYGSDVFIHRPV